MFSPDTNILVIDDMAGVRLFVKNILAELGYKNITEAQDGNEANEILAQKKAGGTPIGLVLCDWNMPGMSGFDLLKSIRGSDQYANLPFVLITAEGELDKVLNAVQWGVSDYVMKPFTKEILLAKLTSVWEKHNLKG
jgi:two-component system chemotaxis response regulator CheY